jgi:hypothetical protein
MSRRLSDDRNPPTGSFNSPTIDLTGTCSAFADRERLRPNSRSTSGQASEAAVSKAARVQRRRTPFSRTNFPTRSINVGFLRCRTII